MPSFSLSSISLLIADKLDAIPVPSATAPSALSFARGAVGLSSRTLRVAAERGPSAAIVNAVQPCASWGRAVGERYGQRALRRIDAVLDESHRLVDERLPPVPTPSTSQPQQQPQQQQQDEQEIILSPAATATADQQESSVSPVLRKFKALSNKISTRIHERVLTVRGVAEERIQTVRQTAVERVQTVRGAAEERIQTVSQLPTVQRVRSILVERATALQRVAAFMVPPRAVAMIKMVVPDNLVFTFNVSCKASEPSVAFAVTAAATSVAMLPTVEPEVASAAAPVPLLASEPANADAETSATESAGEPAAASATEEEGAK